MPRTNNTVMVPEDQNFHGSNRADRFTTITREVLLPQVRKNIVILTDENEETATEAHPDAFRVLIHEGVGYNNGPAMPDRLFGLRVNQELFDSNAAPSFQPGSLLITDPASGFPVAEVIRDNLFIFLDLDDEDWKDASKLYRKILEQVVAEMSLTDEQRATRLAEEEQRRASELPLSVAKLMNSQHERALKSLEEQNLAAIREAADLQQRLFSKLQEARTRAIQISALTKAVEQEELRARQIYSELLGMPLVLQVTVQGQTIQVLTDTLYLVHPVTKQRHTIGQFQLELRLDSLQVTWRNQDHKVTEEGRSYQAPQILNAGGQLPLSNASDDLARLLSRQDLVGAVRLAIEVVETIEADDHNLAYINKWPVAPDQEPVPVSTAA